MTDKFHACHAVTAKWEGGWSDHPADPGGKTMYGITQATLSEYLGRPASAAEIRSLTKAQALVIFRELFWKRVAGDKLPPGVDLCVYDFGVNSGPSRAVKSLQAALGVNADGWIGEITLTALRAHPDIPRLIAELCDRRLAFMKTCRDKETKQLLWPTFGKGWSNRMADIRGRALAMEAELPQPATSPAVPEGGTAKALPAPVEEKSVSTEQKIGAGAAIGTATAILGPLAGIWRDNKDVLTDPAFLILLAVVAVVAGFMLWRKPASVEQQA